MSGRTLPDFFERHIVDSAQLARFLAHDGPILDLGSGAGLPGLVLAILTQRHCVLVESRRLRHQFLVDTAARLGLDNVTVLGERLESVTTFTAAAITARAFAPLARLLPLAARFAAPDTVWILPKGRSAAEELASVEATWQGRFRMEPSVTDPDSRIIVASGVAPRRQAPAQRRHSR